MVITDTHTHLYLDAFDADRAAMMQRAMDAGVTRFFLPAIDSSYTKSMLDMKAAYPEQVHLMAGLHPTHVKESYDDELQHVVHCIEAHDVVAVGEIGIDLYWDQSNFEIQREAFKVQIDLALQYHLPIVIHCRNAFNEVFEVLEEVNRPELRGVMHCFTGTLQEAQRAIALNMMLGIGGVVTFKNGKIDTYLKDISLEHILLETDAPYLAPAPHRGKRNESAYLALVLKKMSDIYQMSEAEIAEMTTANSKRLFKR